MAGAGQAVAADAGVFESLVVGLAGRGEADDREAGLDLGVVDHIGTVHHHHGAGVDGHGAGEVAHVGGFAASTVHPDSVFAQSGEEVFGAGNELAQCFAGNGARVAVDGAGDQDAVDRAHAEQVVDVHDQAVLGGLAEAFGGASFLVVQVSERALGAGAVGVNDVTLVGATGQDVGADFTESARKDATVQIVDHCVDFGFRGRDAALGVAIGGCAHGN